MTSKRISLLLAASVFLTGASGLFLGAMTPVHAITSVDELSDVNRNHWAFDALRDLVEKYDVIEGYPDKTFRGNRTATRWELAAALNSLIKSMGRDLARLGAEKANKTDLAALARLQEEFRDELAAINARTSALEVRATAIEAKNVEQDNRLTLLEKTQIHGDFTFGGLSDISRSGTHLDGSGGRHGITDGLSTLGRLRLSMDIPVREDRDDSLVGEGRVFTRLAAAFGRIAPTDAHPDNAGAFGTFNGYSRIAGDASTFNEGFGANSISGGVVGGNSLRSTLYVESAYYKQHFKSGIPLLTDWFPGMDVLPSKDDDWKATGDLYVGVIPWRTLFDKSPFRGNELTQFQNNAFVNTPGIAVNTTMPMVAYQWHQGLGKSLNMELIGGVGSIDVGDSMNGLNASYEARLNYKTSFLGPELTKPGSLYGGGYHIWQSGNRDVISNAGFIPGIGFSTNRAGTDLTNLSGQSTNAFYAGWNQEWYKGIGTTFNYMLTNNTRTNMAFVSLQQPTGAYASLLNEGILVGARQSLTGVLNIPMAALAPGFRDKDAFGIGYSLTDIQESGISGNVFGDKMEKVAEAYYRWQVNNNISVVPSVQLIWNRLGLEQNGTTAVIGLRTNYTF